MPTPDDEFPTLASVAELAELARKRLPAAAYDYVASGAGDDLTLRANTDAFDRYALRPRVLRDTTALDLGVEIAGIRLNSPLWLAPVGMQQVIHPDGEVATATAAAETGVGYILSSGSSLRLEDIASHAPAARLFQLYKVSEDRGVLADLIHRAADNGYRGLCLTIDNPVHGFRRTALRNAGSTRLPDSQMANLVPYADRLSNTKVAPGPYLPNSHFPTTWADIAWFREQTELPILVKGVLDPDDALLTVEHGLDGVVVSNHGGRQLDHGIATLEALPAIVDAIGARSAILFDGGVRRATDAVIALALGAHAVCLGRSVMWALATGGCAGVTSFLTSFRTELARTMQLMGAAQVADLVPSMVYRRAAEGLR